MRNRWESWPIGRGVAIAGTIARLAAYLPLVAGGLAIVGCQPAAPPPRILAPAKAVESVVEPDNPVPFGYKCTWLAVRSAEPQEVVAALGMANVRRCGWQLGIEAAYQGEVFVAPEVKGWVLVVGNSLPDIAEKKRDDKLTPLVKSLAEKFPDVQYFGTNRIVEYHAWLRAKNGTILRRFAYLGDGNKVLCDEGASTEDEVKLGIVFNKAKVPNEEDVVKLAGAWSVNPTILDELKLDKGVGHLGSLPEK